MVRNLYHNKDSKVVSTCRTSAGVLSTSIGPSSSNDSPSFGTGCKTMTQTTIFYFYHLSVPKDVVLWLTIIFSPSFLLDNLSILRSDQQVS